MSCEHGKSKKKTSKDCIRHFTPAWFAMVMGTGAISILFHSFPYGEGSDALRILSYFFFFMNLVLFVTFCIISLARYTLFPDIWQLMLSHPVQSLYLGTFPMGATTLINVAVSLIYQGDGFGGQGFLYLLWGFWWIDVVLSFLCAWGLVHVMKTRQDHALSRMTAVWLLPVVTLIVGSSTGGVIAPALYPISTSHALITIATSIFMVSVGLCLAFMMLTIYLLRLIVHGLPPGATIISSFMPLGPMAQAGYSILLVGQNLQEILPLRSSTPSVLTSESAGDIVNVICVCIGFVLWALASMWMVFAVMGIYEVSRRNSFPFKLPFWGLIFPNGVYANLTIALYRTLDSPFFRIWGVIYAVATMLLWSWVFGRTMLLTYNGQIFEAPCLEDIDMAKYPPEVEDGRSNGSGDAPQDGAGIRLELRYVRGRSCSRR